MYQSYRSTQMCLYKTIYNMKEQADKSVLIVKFMGLNPSEYLGKYSLSLNHCSARCDTLEETIESFASISKYHTSWEWLMPVVEMIEYLGYGVTIGMGDYCIIQNGWKDDLEEIYSMTENGKLLCTYNAVVQFIEWYNKQ